VSMELDDLLKEVGLDAAGLEDALVWARRRAAELVREIDDDPELGPLLGTAKPMAASEAPRPRRVEPKPTVEDKPRPMFNDLRGLQAAFLAENEDEDADLPDVGAVLRAFKKGRTGSFPVLAASAGPITATEDEPLLATSDAARTVTSPRDEARTEPQRESEATAAASRFSLDDADAPRHTAAEDLDETPEPADDVLAEVGAAEQAPATDDEPTSEALATRSEADDEAADDEAAALESVPAPSEPELDPLAGIDFDDLPGMDEDDEDDDHTYVDLPSPSLLAAAVAAVGERELDNRTTMVPMDGPDLTLPSMQAPHLELGLGRQAEGLPTVGELTERTRNPLLSAEPPGEVTVTSMAPHPARGAGPDTAVSDITAPSSVEAAAEEEPAEEFELLDDEDLLLVEEEPEDDDVPEWKQALANTHVGEDDEGEG
jgi:hypothetical protein